MFEKMNCEQTWKMRTNPGFIRNLTVYSHCGNLTNLQALNCLFTIAYIIIWRFSSKFAGGVAPPLKGAKKEGYIGGVCE